MPTQQIERTSCWTSWQEEEVAGQALMEDEFVEIANNQA
jgi:hypothetical protein